MDKKQLNNTIREITTPSGETIKVTLNFFLLYGVKSKYPDIYKRFNKVLTESMDDVFEAIDIIYTGYLCALPEGEKPMPYEGFMLLFEDDVQGTMGLAYQLLARKKKAASATHS